MQWQSFQGGKLVGWSRAHFKKTTLAEPSPQQNHHSCRERQLWRNVFGTASHKLRSRKERQQFSMSSRLWYSCIWSGQLYCTVLPLPIDEALGQGEDVDFKLSSRAAGVKGLVPQQLLSAFCCDIQRDRFCQVFVHGNRSNRNKGISGYIKEWTCCIDGRKTSPDEGS